MYILFLKIASRYLMKNRLYSFINIMGLSFGLASFIFIMLYVNYELSYDKFENSENVYRVFMEYKEGETFYDGDAQTYNLSGPTLKKVFPEVEEQVRFYRLGQVNFIKNGNAIQDFTGTLADPSYFDVFSYSLLKGNKNNVLTKPNSIVLTESLAKKLFGDEEPMGKSVSMYYDWDELILQVTGVMEDLPPTVHMKVSFLIPFESLSTWSSNDRNQIQPNWNQNNFYTFLKVNENADIDLLREKIKEEKSNDDENERHNIEVLESIHLHSNKPYEAEVNGSATRVNFLGAISIIILLLSWLNYVNLSTAKSLERAKEIGIRKVVGAHRPQLILQSNLESLLLNLASIIIALLFVSAFYKPFSRYIGKELSFGIAEFTAMLPAIGFVIVGILLASLYPALLLSHYRPAQVLKGKLMNSPRSYNIRKGLIVFQFLTTIVLIIGTITVSKQIAFLREQPTGVKLDQVITLNSSIVSEKPDSLAFVDFKLFKKELDKLSFVESTALSQTFPGDDFDVLSSFMGIEYPNGKKDEEEVYYNYTVDHNYLDLVGIKLLAGRSFIERPNGRSPEIIINEKLSKKMGYAKPEEAIHEVVSFWGDEWEIVGVVENYYHFGLKNTIRNMLLIQRNVNNNLLVKLSLANSSKAELSKLLAQVEQMWKTFFPQSSFSYKLLDKNFEAQYKEDEQFSIAFRIFTILAIVIAFLGLFGLTSYTAIQRKKEIGIRKVNGASLFEILILLNKDFLKWVGISFLIAIPIAWYVMKAWLEGFALQTELSWWIFALSGLIAYAIAIITVSYQSFKAANLNPVEALGSE